MSEYGGLSREVARQVECCGLRGARVVVAASGGPDSLALLHALHALKRPLRLDIRAAHFDHGLRRESRADADFVRDFAESIGVPAIAGGADVDAFRRARRLSLEDAARRLRYEFLAKAASETGADAVALGHTADDQAETVLMRILRGTGLDGLGAMSPMSAATWAGRRVNLFRPLLGVSKAETLAYCADNGLNPRVDESNLSTEMTRNRARLELLPILETYNPAAKSALNRLAKSARLDMSFIRRHAELAAERVMTRRADGVSLDRAAFAELHPAIQRHTLRIAAQTAAGDRADLSEAHIEAMLAVMSGPAGRGIDLPRGVRFETDYRQARLRRADGEPAAFPEPPSAPVAIAARGETVAGGWRVRAEPADCESALAAARYSPPAAPGTQLSEIFAATALGDNLRVRTRATSDRFQPLGMKSDKNLADFMIDAHTPRELRDKIPLLESGGRVAWVVGWRIADWAKATPGGRRCARISFERREG